MKFNLIIIIAIIMFAGAATAQPVNIGIKGGLNLYTVNSNSTEPSYNSKPSFYLGLLGHIHMAEQFALQPEIVYSRQGARYDNDLALDLNYFNVPILFQYMFDNGFRLQAGPQIGVLVGAKANGADVKNEYKGGDFGLAFGASYVNTESGFGVDARYNAGLSDISETSATSSYNRGFQLGVFYMFKHRS
jgi:hypothetical protein